MNIGITKAIASGWDSWKLFRLKTTPTTHNSDRAVLPKEVPERAVIPFPGNNHLLAETTEYIPNDNTSDCTTIPSDIIGKEIIGGKFKVISYMESGGIADIFVVQDETGNKYAAKILKPDSKHDTLKRILRESEVMVLLSNKPNILEFIALGHIDVRPIVVSEFADEGSLYAKAQRGDLTFGQAIAYLRDAANGLVSMHDIGLIHRDIKPKNILIVGDEAKLSDFDLTASIDDDLYISIEDGISGTVNYISPEQINGVNIDFKSDVYSLGVTAYNIFAGRLPFIGEAVSEVIEKHLKEEPISPSTFNKYIPSKLEELILQSMSKDPTKRPTALEFKARLDSLLVEAPMPDIKLKHI